LTVTAAPSASPAMQPGTATLLNQTASYSATFGQNILTTASNTTTWIFSIPDLPTFSPMQQARLVASAPVLLMFDVEVVLGAYGDVADGLNTLVDLIQQKPSGVVENDTLKDGLDILNNYTIPVPFVSEGLSQKEETLSTMLLNIFNK
jgi:hypothetical protein